MNAKQGLNQKIIALFILLALILMAPLIALQIWSKTLINQKQKLFDHLSSICTLPSHLKYSMIFAVDSLYRLSPLMLLPEKPSTLGSENFIEEAYDYFSSTGDLVERTLPGSFSNYASLYNSVIYKNVCSVVPGLAIDMCTSNTFMTTGVYTSSTQVMTRASDASKQQVRISALTDTMANKIIEMNTEMSNILLDAAVENLIQMNGIAFDYLILTFYNSMHSYITQVFVGELLIVIAGIVVLLLVIIFIWRPYIANLNSNIWRTKGMLSMIPMDVILANDALRSAMLNGDLMKAVK